MRGFRNRYLISWTFDGQTGREIWVMERRGSISSADIKRMEKELGKKWGTSQPVIITNVVSIN